VIDADNTGEVKVIIMNHGKKDYQVKEGDRIAEIIIEKIEMSGMMEVDNQRITDRGKKRFRSRDLPPKQTIAVKQLQPIMCQLYMDSREIGCLAKAISDETHGSSRKKSWYQG